MNCPECRATLSRDEVDPNEPHCPYCSAALDWPAGDVDDRDDRHLSENHTSSGTDSLPEHSQAPTGGFEIVEQSSDRLVVHLPPANSTGGIGFFAFVWNAFMVVFTTIMVVALLSGKGEFDGSPIGFALFISLFWAVGIGFIILWVRMRFTRVFVLLEKDRLVVQRKLFRTSNRELVLGAAPQASLVVAYESNDVPVHTLEIRGEGGAEKLGVALAPSAQRELMLLINDFLGVAPPEELKAAEVCSLCGTMLPGTEPLATSFAQRKAQLRARISPGTVPSPRLCAECEAKTQSSGQPTFWEPLFPDQTADLPEGLLVDSAPVGEWRFSYPLLPSGKFRSIATLLATIPAIMIAGIGLFMFSGAKVPNQPMGVLFLVFPILFSVMPLVMVGSLLVAVRSGRIRVTLTREEARLQWGWGMASIKKKIPIATVTDCRITVGMRTTSKSSSSPEATQSVSPIASLSAGGPVPYPLTTTHSSEFAQKVVRLVRTYWKEELNRPLPD